MMDERERHDEMRVVRKERKGIADETYPGPAWGVGGCGFTEQAMV